MESVFVTGATGFIGSKLVEILLDRGFSVRGLSRQTNPTFPPRTENSAKRLWDHPNFQIVQGDITDPQAIRRGMQGCSRVFHLAAYAKNWAPNPRTYAEMNVDAMRSVFQIAKELQVQRLVWTSTIVTFGPTRPGEVRDENSTPRLTDTFFTEYEKSKFLAEQEALRFAEDGLPVVIVNPTRVYGPGRLSEGNAVSQLMIEYTRGRAPFLPNLGVNVGNYGFVGDIALGHLLAMEKGRIGQRYILGGENASLRQFFNLIDEVSGTKRWKIPLFKFWPLVFARMQERRAKMFGIYPRITPGWMRTFLTDWTYSCEKAKTELGYDPIPFRRGLELTWNWIADSHIQ